MPNKSLDASGGKRVSELTRCGERYFGSRRRLNSNVMPLRPGSSMKCRSLLALVCLCVVASLATQSDATVYSYRVSGKIIFKKFQSPPGVTVYVMGTRPLGGRIPWVHAARDGTFSIEFSGAPDDFRLCAHPGETGGRLPLARTPDKAKKMPIKLSCTKDSRLDGDHRDERVELKLK